MARKGTLFLKCRVWIFITTISLILAPTVAQECDEQSPANNHIFQTILHVQYKGEPFDVGSKSGAARALGSCRNLTEHEGKMVDFFSGYGVNLSGEMRDNPYVAYEEEGFSFTPHNDDQYRSRIYSGSYSRMSKIINRRMGFAEWSLTAKKLHCNETNNNCLLSRQTVIYGMLRFRLSDREVCMEYRSRNPIDFSTYGAAGAIPVDLVVQEGTWGWGSMRAVAIIGQDGSLSYNAIITFPAHHPYPTSS